MKWYDDYFLKKKKTKVYSILKITFGNEKKNGIPFFSIFICMILKKKLNWLRKFVDFTNQTVNMLNKISKEKSWKSKNRKCRGRYLEITRLDFFSTPGNERRKTKILGNILKFCFLISFYEVYETLDLEKSM